MTKRGAGVRDLLDELESEPGPAAKASAKKPVERADLDIRW